MTRQIIIHADGACSGNPGPGGWAATIAIAGSDTRVLTGGDPHTTNNIMELVAAQEALRHVFSIEGFHGSDVVLRLDSEYVLKGLREWLPGWKRRGWRTASGGEVKNRGIWEDLDRLKTDLEARTRLILIHVRGHSNDPENDLVDALAVTARDQSRKAAVCWEDPVRALSAEVPSTGPEVSPEAAQIDEAGLQAGFNRYACPLNANAAGYLFSMQKKITDGEDTLFFANVDFWDMARITRNTVQGIRGTVKAQFHTGDNLQGDAIDVSFAFRDFGAAEATLDAMWHRMEYGRYEQAPPRPEA